MTDLVTALEESHRANERMAFRLKVMSWVCVGLVAIVTVLSVSILFFAAAVTALRSDQDVSAQVLSVGECRTRAVVRIDQIKDDPKRTPLALELVNPATSPERRVEIAEIFSKQANEIKKLQDARLACGDE